MKRENKIKFTINDLDTMPYYIILFILEPSIFFFMSHDSLICDCDICHALWLMWLSYIISHYTSLSKSKIIKIKTKIK